MGIQDTIAAPMRALLRFWLALGQPIKRSTYVRQGVALALVKYAGDVVLWRTATGKTWTPLDYLHSVYSVIDVRLDGAPSYLLPLVAAWTIPFVWLGVTLSVRRAFDAGITGAWAFLYFVPYVNYLLMAALTVLPSRPSPQVALADRTDPKRSAALAAVSAGVAVGLLTLAVAVLVLNAYGAALFFGGPFIMGCLTAFVFNRRYDADEWDTIGVVALMFLAAGALIFLLAVEGIVCIVMSLPIALFMGLIAAPVGRTLARRSAGYLPPAFLAVVVLPFAAVLEPMGRQPVLHEVRTAVEINALPSDVWPHVLAFDPIPPPVDLPFRLGIAYPEYARIDGTGVGAIRHCVFSTGAFVEPITAWEPGRRLAFDVVASPAPLRELTWRESVTPPHLDGYLQSRRGEFRLVSLPGGRTQLEGSTWYQLRMNPEGYWQLWADFLIRRIHQRVLIHIKNEVESRDGRQGGTAG